MGNATNNRHIDLFAGIGGFSIAAERAGFKTVVFCEKDPFCRKVIAKHWPDIPCVADIRDFDGTQHVGASLLTGGFPCQPFSIAGKRRGKADDRYLWKEMLRVVSQAKPTWVVGENVVGIIKMALDEVLADLEGAGYDGQPLVIPACGVGAPHERKRTWIVARSRDAGGLVSYADSVRRVVGGGDRQGGQVLCHEDGNSQEGESERGGRIRGADAALKVDAHPSRTGGVGLGEDRSEDAWGCWWDSLPGMDGVVYGVPSELDESRVKALGNAIVPQVAYQILKEIADIEFGAR